MEKAAFIGFGEAGRAFAGLRGPASAFDLKLLDAAARAEVERAVEEAGVAVSPSTADAVRDAGLVLSVVTADQAVRAAEAAAPALTAGALYCDMNSVAPDTKRRAAAIVEAAGARYVDVGVMAPVRPAGLAVPLLVSGPQAEAAVAALTERGFTDVRAVGVAVGAASAVKMIRSVMVKGMEALTVECMLAADAAGVRDEVLRSLDASARSGPAAARADYDLDRVMTHGLRRAAEMEEVVRTLDALGVGSAMSRATVERQRAVGALRLSPPPGLDAKLARLRPAARRRDAA